MRAIAIFLTLTALASLPYVQAEALGSWTNTSAYPTNISDLSCATYSGYIYCVGGNTGVSPYSTDAVYSAPVSSGGVGTWTSTTVYPTNIAYESCAIDSGYIYCVGGYTGSAYTDAVYSASVAGGSVGAWTLSTNPYPTNISRQSCATYSGYIYCVGGWTGSAYTDAVYSASVAGGGVGTWTSTTVYPTNIAVQSCATYSGYIYCVGGTTGSAYTDAVYSASVAGGGVGTWASTTAYPTNIDIESCTIDSWYIYCVGGYSVADTDAVYYAAIVTLYASPSSGPAGTVVTLSGSSYTPSATYSYCLSTSNSSVSCVPGTPSPAPQFTANSTGYIPSGTTLTVPSGTAPGRYYAVVYSGSPAVITAYAPFTVNPLASVTVTAPANNTAVLEAYVPINVKVVTSPASLDKDAGVSVFVNSSTPVCPVANATGSGLYSCAYQVEASGGFELNVTATMTLPSGSFSLKSRNYYFSAKPILQTIPLVQGWNLISTPIVPANTAIATVLGSQIVGGNFSAVWSYQGGKWVSVMLSGGKLSGTLTTFQDGYGYWIYMTKPDNLFIVGSVFPPPPTTPPAYQLSSGWNLVGFKPEPTVTNETVGAYLSSISGSYLSNNVWVYDNTSQAWIRADSSYMLQPGEAMWIMITALATLRP